MSVIKDMLKRIFKEEDEESGILDSIHKMVKGCEEEMKRFLPC